VIFVGIEIRGRPEFPLKIKGAFRDRSVRFEDTSSEYRGFRPAL
jgi:hypothetical protein